MYYVPEKHPELYDNLFEKPFENLCENIREIFDNKCEKLNKKPFEKPTTIPVSHVQHHVLPLLQCVLTVIIHCLMGSFVIIFVRSLGIIITRKIVKTTMIITLRRQMY